VAEDVLVLRLCSVTCDDGGGMAKYWKMLGGCVGVVGDDDEDDDEEEEEASDGEVGLAVEVAAG